MAKRAVKKVPATPAPYAPVLPAIIEVMVLGKYRKPQLGSWTPPTRQIAN